MTAHRAARTRSCACSSGGSRRGIVTLSTLMFVISLRHQCDCSTQVQVSHVAKHRRCYLFEQAQHAACQSRTPEEGIEPFLPLGVAFGELSRLGAQPHARRRLAVPRPRLPGSRFLRLPTRQSRDTGTRTRNRPVNCHRGLRWHIPCQ
jgi:hypothetical protein